MGSRATGLGRDVASHADNLSARFLPQLLISFSRFHNSLSIDLKIFNCRICAGLSLENMVGHASVRPRRHLLIELLCRRFANRFRPTHAGHVAARPAALGPWGRVDGWAT